MSDDSPARSANEGKKQAPVRRSLARRVAIGALKAGFVLGGIVAVVLGGSWLNVMPGGWRVRTMWTRRTLNRQLQTFRDESTKIPEGSVVFLGSSTIAKMPMAKLFGDAPVVNRGIGAENTLALLDRLDVSLPVARPAGVVINAGANDFRADRLEPKMVIARAATVVDRVRARFPGVPITILEPLAQNYEDPDLVLQLTYVTEGLQEYAQTNGFPYVRLNRPPLVTEDGLMRPDMTAGDGRHPNEQAYAVIAKWVAEDGGEATAPLRDAMAKAAKP